MTIIISECLSWCTLSPRGRYHKRGQKQSENQLIHQQVSRVTRVRYVTDGSYTYAGSTFFFTLSKVMKMSLKIQSFLFGFGVMLIK